MKRYLLLLTFMAAFFSAHASTVHPSYEGFMQRVGGTSTTVSFASDGKPILVGSRHLGTPHIGSMGLTPGPNGVTLRSSGGLGIPGKTGTIPIIATTVLSRTILGRAFQIALPMLTLASGAVLVNDAEIILQSLGLYHRNNNFFQVPNADQRSIIGYYRPIVMGRPFPISHPFTTSRHLACQIAIETFFNSSNRTYKCNFQSRSNVNAHTVSYNYVINQYINGVRNTFFNQALQIHKTHSSWCASHQILNWNERCVTPINNLPLTPEQISDVFTNATNINDKTLLAATRIAANPAIAPQLLPEKQRLPVELQFPGGHQSMEILEVEPQTVTRTRVLPDGNIETKTQTTQRVARIQPTTQRTPSPTVQFEEQTVTKRKVTTPTGLIVLPEETVSTETKPHPQEQPPNCGLPNTPPCRIYEPQAMPRAPMDDAARTLDTIRKDIEACLSDIPECLGLPDISFTFSMPSACSPLALPGFERWINPLDICVYKSYFHSVMGMVWAITGVFGAMAIIGRRF